MLKARTLFATSALALVLAACGGGGSDSPPDPPPPIDSDRDGVADANDCAAQDAQAWQILSFAARNDDGDIARVNSSGQLCAGGALPANRFAAAVPAGEADCDDTNGAIWVTRTYEAIDTDRDGFAVAASGSLCSGAALPAGHLASLPAAADLDCDDADDGRWRLLAHAGRDNDGDGHFVAASGSLCGQGSLPAHLQALAPTGLRRDCDDADAARWNWHGVYRDLDGDGVGAGRATYQCLGNGNPTAGFVRRGHDPNDDANDSLATTQTESSIDSAMLAVEQEVDDDDIN